VKALRTKGKYSFQDSYLTIVLNTTRRAEQALGGAVRTFALLGLSFILEASFFTSCSRKKLLPQLISDHHAQYDTTGRPSIGRGRPHICLARAVIYTGGIFLRKLFDFILAANSTLVLHCLFQLAAILGRYPLAIKHGIKLHTHYALSATAAEPHHCSTCSRLNACVGFIASNES